MLTHLKWDSAENSKRKIGPYVYSSCFGMDKTLREMLEKEIDDLIKLETWEGIIGSLDENWEGFPPIPMDNSLGSWFAVVVGVLILSFRGITELWYRRQPTADEVREFREVIERRAGEIKSQIKLALSK